MMAAELLWGGLCVEFRAMALDRVEENQQVLNASRAFCVLLFMDTGKWPVLLLLSIKRVAAFQPFRECKVRRSGMVSLGTYEYWYKVCF